MQKKRKGAYKKPAYLKSKIRAMISKDIVPLYKKYLDISSNTNHSQTKHYKWLLSSFYVGHNKTSENLFTSIWYL